RSTRPRARRGWGCPPATPSSSSTAAPSRPRRATAAAPCSPSGCGRRARVAERTAPRGRVLVAEDEEYVRASLEEVLRARGFDRGTASDVESAVRHLAKSPVDVLLADLRMPGGGGLELVKRARVSSPGVPVVVLTGHGTVASAVECMKAGAADYLL